MKIEKITQTEYDQYKPTKRTNRKTLHGEEAKHLKGLLAFGAFMAHPLKTRQAKT